jgi:hypothetical protein
VTDPTQARRSAIELTLHRLQHPNQPEAFEDTVYGTLSRLCPNGVDDVMALAIHLADAMAAVLVKDCGSREEAIGSLQQQLAKAHTNGSTR